MTTISSSPCLCHFLPPVGSATLYPLLGGLSCWSRLLYVSGSPPWAERRSRPLSSPPALPPSVGPLVFATPISCWLKTHWNLLTQCIGRITNSGRIGVHGGTQTPRHRAPTTLRVTGPRSNNSSTRATSGKENGTLSVTLRRRRATNIKATGAGTGLKAIGGMTRETR